MIEQTGSKVPDELLSGIGLQPPGGEALHAYEKRDSEKDLDGSFERRAP